MKILLPLLFITLFNFSFAQESATDTCVVTPFQVYLQDQDPFSNIRNAPGGDIILKINNQHGYGYILTIIDFKNGWFKINHVSGIDSYDITNFEGWIHSSIVAAATTYDLVLMDKPNGTITTGKLKGEHDTFNITNVYCNWIQVNCNGVTGWVESSKICGNPVTTCP
ncbi:MAG: hypothetical protein R3279_02095 [Putridiphycobacter sp.]|nr:hypothetical protein [Putridiphycobacter sp.]